jgi:hypothetical protein
MISGGSDAMTRGRFVEIAVSCTELVKGDIEGDYGEF